MPYQAPPPYPPGTTPNRMAGMGYGAAPAPYRLPVQPRPNRSAIQYLKIIGAVILAAGIVYIRFQQILPTRPKPKEEAPEYSPIKYLKFSAENPYASETLRENVMTYIMHPRLLYAEFGGQALAQKLFKGAWVEEYDRESREVYLGLDKSKVSSDGLPLYISDFVANLSRVEFATDNGREIRLKDYTADRVKFYSAYLFKTPLDNLKVDIDETLDFDSYQISMREMADFMANRTIYGGNPEIHSPNNKRAASILFANHGTFVARPHEPSLQRFMKKYLNRFPAAEHVSREQQMQLLLDFVSEEIEYDDKEATSHKEWLKRPNETLISRRGDCSNKSILYASLLEQMDEDYLLVYIPGHITVAVRQGDFSVYNGLSFGWQGQTWVIAETTVPGFQIGQSMVKGAEAFRQIEYIQRPSQQGTIYSYATSQPLIMN